MATKSMKKAELIQYCIDNNIDGYQGLTKPNIFTLINSKKTKAQTTLNVGESVEIPSSSTDQVYKVIKTEEGYTCTCKGWQFNRSPKRDKTCRHVKQVRCGVKTQRKKAKIQKNGPEKLILAENYTTDMNVISWYMSEKIDGIRAYWDGQQFWSRTGKEIHTPSFFTEDLPKNIPLDGELFMKQSIVDKSKTNLFSKVCSITRKKIPVNEEWSDICFYVFDTVKHDLPFVDRHTIIKKLINISPFCVILNQYNIKTIKQLNDFHDNITSRGGEGVMIKNPHSMYVGRRTKDLLKLKTFYDTEVKIIGHKSGEGKYVGMLGAYECVMVNGKNITVGSGMNDANRQSPLPINTFITIKYFELTTKNKVPRFPVFLRKAERQQFSDGPIPGSR